MKFHPLHSVKVIIQSSHRFLKIPYMRTKKRFILFQQSEMNENLHHSCKKDFKLQQFEIEQVLGEGSYGFVSLAAHDGAEYALKEMSKYRLAKNHCEHIPFVQKELLKNISHPGIITLHGAFQTHSKLYLVLQACQEGPLQEYIHKNLSQELKRFYFAQLVNTVEYLHSIGVVHRDLKPSNILRAETGHLKLIDFGSACVKNCTVLCNGFKDKLQLMKAQKQSVEKHEEQQHRKVRKRKSTFVGTIEYMSPQLITNNQCNFSSDLWALGCILYFMYLGRSPFSDPCELTQFEKIKKGIYEYPKNQAICTNAKDLISKLLVLNPEQRLGSCKTQNLSFEALKSHLFFDKMDFNNIFKSKPPNFVNSINETNEILTKLSKQNISQQQQVFTIFLSRKVHSYYLIFKCHFYEDLRIEQYQHEGSDKQPNIYKLQGRAQQITSMKFMIKVSTNIGSSNLFYQSCNLREVVEKINNIYQGKGQSKTQIS